MKSVIKQFLALLLAFSFIVSGVTPLQAAGPTLDHRFYLELPDGSRSELKGAKIHKYYEGNVGEGEKPYLVGSYCRYDGFGEELQRGISSGYHCSTNESCFASDYGAPYLPKSFNAGERVYNNSDASFFAFNNKTFTSFLTEKASYLSGLYDSNNIRGFAGAKWQANLDFDNGASESKLTIPSDLSNAEYLSAPEWGSIPNYSGKQSWSVGEVYRNENGGNVLQGRITWVLKVPEKPLEQATAKLSGVCGPQTWDGPLSYKLTINNFDLKGGTFKEAHIFLGFAQDAKSAPIKQFLGTPSYDDGTYFGYYLKTFTSLPNPQQLTLDFNDTVSIGSGGKKLSQLVTFLDQNRAATLPRINIQANLVTTSGSQTVLNGHIGTYSVKMTKNECATPPTGGGVIPACVSLSVQTADNQNISNLGALLPGDRIKFVCGPVTGITRYAFRVITFNAQNAAVGSPQNINPESTNSNKSAVFTIPTAGGKFTAQCGICDNNGGNCQFDVPNYKTPTTTTSPTQCPAQYSCVTATGCLTPAPGNALCPVSGQVCCANRSRQE